MQLQSGEGLAAVDDPSTGNGGTCYGDSGDAWCRASDKTYRVDTPAARDFLNDYVALP
jgi:hypothetical protein